MKKNMRIVMVQALDTSAKRYNVSFITLPSFKSIVTTEDAEEFVRLLKLELQKDLQGESDREWLQRNQHILPTEKPTPF